MEHLGSVLIYGLNALLSSLCVHYALKYKKINQMMMYIVLIIMAVFLPSLLGGVRYGIGTDYFARYYPDYMILENDLYGTTRVEAGFELISRFVVFFGLGFQFMLFLVQVLTNGFIIAAVLEEQKYISPALATFFYMLLYYQCSYNLVRQCLAMAIIFYAFRFVKRKKFLPYLIFCLAATSVHTTAIVMILVYFVANIWTERKLRVLKWIIYVLLMAVIFYIDSIFKFFNQFLPIDYYSRYIPDTTIEGISLYFFIKWFLYLVPGTVMIYYYHHKDLRRREEQEKSMRENHVQLKFDNDTDYIDPEALKRYNFYLAFTICGFLLSFTAYMDSQALFRMSYYFNLGLVYVMTAQCSFSRVYIRVGAKQGKLKLFTVYAVIVMMVFWFYEYFIRGQSQTVPYQWIFNANTF